MPNERLGRIKGTAEVVALSIGLAGAPSLVGLGLAVLFVAVAPLKVGLFFWLMTRFNLRVRTAVQYVHHR